MKMTDLLVLVQNEINERQVSGGGELQEKMLCGIKNLPDVNVVDLPGKGEERPDKRPGVSVYSPPVGLGVPLALILSPRFQFPMQGPDRLGIGNSPESAIPVVSPQIPEEDPRRGREVVWTFFPEVVQELVPCPSR